MAGRGCPDPGGDLGVFPTPRFAGAARAELGWPHYGVLHLACGSWRPDLARREGSRAGGPGWASYAVEAAAHGEAVAENWRLVTLLTRVGEPVEPAIALRRLVQWAAHDQGAPVQDVGVALS